MVPKKTKWRWMVTVWLGGTCEKHPALIKNALLLRLFFCCFFLSVIFKMGTNSHLLSLCFSLESTRASPGPEPCGESSPYWKTWCIKKKKKTKVVKIGGYRTVFWFHMTHHNLIRYLYIYIYSMYSICSAHVHCQHDFLLCAAAINKIFSILLQPVESAWGAER